MTSESENELYLLARRYISGELTDVQFKWWIVKLNSTPKEVFRIYNKQAKANLKKNLIEFIFIAFLALVAVGFISLFS